MQHAFLRPAKPLRPSGKHEGAVALSTVRVPLCLYSLGVSIAIGVQQVSHGSNSQQRAAWLKLKLALYTTSATLQLLILEAAHQRHAHERLVPVLGLIQAEERASHGALLGQRVATRSKEPPTDASRSDSSSMCTVHCLSNCCHRLPQKDPFRHLGDQLKRCTMPGSCIPSQLSGGWRWRHAAFSMHSL